MQIFLKEFHKSKKIFLISALIIIPFIIIYLSLYPLYLNYIDYFKELLSNVPPKIRLFFNIDLNSIETITAYYTFVFKLLSSIVSITTIWVGIRVLATDKSGDCFSFYFKKPLSRKKILLIKIAANLVWLLICFTAFHIISFLMILILNRHELTILLLLQINSSLILIALVFYFIGLVIGAYLKTDYYSFWISLLTIFIFTVISIIDQSFNIWLLEYLNPLSYFQISDILETGTYQYRFLVATTFLLFFLYQYVTALYENEEIGGNNFD